MYHNVSIQMLQVITCLCCIGFSHWAQGAAVILNRADLIQEGAAQSGVSPQKEGTAIICYYSFMHILPHVNPLPSKKERQKNHLRTQNHTFTETPRVGPSAGANLPNLPHFRGTAVARRASAAHPPTALWTSAPACETADRRNAGGGCSREAQQDATVASGAHGDPFCRWRFDGVWFLSMLRPIRWSASPAAFWATRGSFASGLPKTSHSVPVWLPKVRSISKPKGPAAKTKRGEQWNIVHCCPATSGFPGPFLEGPTTSLGPAAGLACLYPFDHVTT